MPLIEYECQACHKRVEKIQSFSAPPQTVCPHCGGRLEQTISAPAVQFKGGGWYVTDYAKSGATKPAVGDKSEGAKTDSAAESKSESKSDNSAKSEGASPKKESASKNESAPGPAPSSTPSTSSKSD